MARPRSTKAASLAPEVVNSPAGAFVAMEAALTAIIAELPAEAPRSRPTVREIIAAYAADINGHARLLA